MIAGVGKKHKYYEVADVAMMSNLALEGRMAFSAFAQVFDAVAVDRSMSDCAAVQRMEEVFKRKQLQPVFVQALILFWEGEIHGDALEKQNLWCLTN